MSDLHAPALGSWAADAQCRDMDINLFFPGSESVIPWAAAETCRVCPVCHDCREYAIENRIVYGVWGGLNWSQRRRIVRYRRTLTLRAG